MHHDSRRSLAPRLAFALVLSAGLAAPAVAQSDQPKDTPPTDPALATDAKALFQRAADALKGVQTVRYKASIKTDAGMMAAAYPPSRVDVVQSRDANAAQQGGWLSQIRGAMTKDAKDIEFGVAWLANSVELLDSTKKQLTERRGGSINGPGVQIAGNARMRDFFAASPFAKQLAMTEFTLEGTRTISGQECDVVVASDGRTKTRWAFAKSDGLPRLTEQIFEGIVSGNVTVEVTDFTTDTTPVGESDMRLKVPEGYTEDRGSGIPGSTRVTPPTPPIEPPSGLPKSNPASTPVDPEQTPEAPKASEGPKAAADFELLTPTGDKVALKDLRGKVVVAQFFGSWCLPCADWHGRLADQLKALPQDQLAKLALAVRERDVQNASVALPADAGFKLLLNADAVAKDYAVALFPTTVVIDRDGFVRATVEGQTSEDAAVRIANAVRDALGLPAPSDDAATKGA
jgi:peroxiredoxin